MNLGLSATLKAQFPTVLPYIRPVVNTDIPNNPNWFVGFVDGDGCFYTKIVSRAKGSLPSLTDRRYVITMILSISQHVRDELLLAKFIDYLGCGRIEKVSTEPNKVTFVVGKFSDILSKIVPFFQNNPLQGIKNMDFLDFCEIVKIMENKDHLTLEGIKKIKSLKSGMNIGRKYI